MNPSLALVVWFFVILIIFFIFWIWAGYTAWESLAVATLISLIILIILFPWNFEHHHKDKDKDCNNFGQTGFFIIAAISIVILIAYIISTFIFPRATVIIS